MIISISLLMRNEKQIMIM